MGQESKHDPPSEGAILARNVIEGIVKTKKLSTIVPQHLSKLLKKNLKTLSF